jgi:hypothetical protein
MRNDLRKLFWVAIFLGFVLCSLWYPGDAAARSDEIKTTTRTIPFQGEKHLTVIIDIGVGTIDIKRNSTGDILNAEVEYNPDDIRVEIDYDKRKDKGELYLVSERRDKGLDIDSDENHWYLEFGNKVPISFEIDIGACEAEFDFSGLRIDGLDMDVGASSIVVDFRKLNPERIPKIRIDVGASELEINGLGNANFEKLSFDGGVGDFTLDFSGDFKHRSYVDMNVGLGSLSVLVPRDAGVQIRSESSFLSSFSIDEDDFEEVDDDIYESDNFGDTDKELVIEIDVGLGSVEVDYTRR